MFASPLIHHSLHKADTFQNHFFQLDSERRSLVSILKKTQRALQVRVEYLKTESDLRKLVHLEGILHISDYSNPEVQMSPNDVECCLMLEDEVHVKYKDNRLGWSVVSSDAVLSDRIACRSKRFASVGTRQ